MCKKHQETHVLNPCRKLSQTHGCQAVISRTGLEFLVSRLRLGSSRTTAAHRDNLSAMIQPFDQQTVPEKNQWPRLRPRANAIETGSAWQSHEPLPLPWPRGNQQPLMRTAQAPQAAGFLSNSELFHGAAHPRHAPTNIQSSIG